MKAVIWDVDGTLVDSRSSIFRAAVEAAHVINVKPPTYDEVRAIVGLSLFDALAMMRPDLGHDVITAYTHEFQQSFLRFHAEPGFSEDLYPDAQNTLQRLKKDGWLMGMATGNSRRGVTRCLETHAWHDLFDVTFCADDGHSKPHPQMLQLNLDALGIDPSDAVMIGDASHDMKMARQAGVYAIGVSWGFHTVDELHQSGAHEIVHNFQELTAALAVLGSKVTHQPISVSL